MLTGESIEGKLTNSPIPYGRMSLIVQTVEGNMVIPLHNIEKIEFPDVDFETFQKDKKSTLKPVPAIDKIKNFINDKFEAYPVLVALQDRGELRIEDITKVLDNAGYPNDLASTRRLLDTLIELEAIELADFHKYRITNYGKEAIR